MPRIRYLKPDFFLDSKISKKKPLVRIFFQGLWVHADREGRLEEDQDRLKVQILPYDKVNVESMLKDLEPEFIIRYERDQNGNVITSRDMSRQEISGNKRYIQIKNFLKHQRPHPHEGKSEIPPITDDEITSRDMSLQVVTFNSGIGKGMGIGMGKGMGIGIKDGVAASATSKGKANPNYQTAVDHILDTYQKGPGKGQKYPFSGKDGKAVKRLLGIYGIDVFMAMWEDFLACNWDWYDKGNKLVKVPRNLQVFESKLTELLERETYKSRLSKKPKNESKGISTIGKVLNDGGLT